MLRSLSWLIVGLSLLSSPAFADDSPDATAPSAEQLFQEGSRLLKAGRIDAACARLSASQQQEPAIGTLGLLAYCHEQQGLLATAMREYKAVAELARAAAQGTREHVALARAAELEKRVPYVEVVLSNAPSEVEVFLGDRRLQPPELRVPTASDPGSLRLRVTAPQHEPYDLTLSVPSDGSTLRVVVPPLARSPAREALAARPAAPPPTAAPSARARTSERVALWSGLALGAAGVALGSYTGLSALASNRASAPHCQGNSCDAQGVEDRSRALTQARISTVSFGAAALGLGVATYFLLKDHGRAEAPAASLSIGPQSCALGYQRAF
jgi:hypothetical protein